MPRFATLIVAIAVLCPTASYAQEAGCGDTSSVAVERLGQLVNVFRHLPGQESDR